MAFHFLVPLIKVDLLIFVIFPTNTYNSLYALMYLEKLIQAKG